MENYVKSVHATSLTYKQTVPKVPAANTFVIRLQNESRETETDAHYRIDREYQLVYFGANEQDVLAKMDTLGTAFYETEQIPVNASTRFIRVEAFSFSMPFKTENALYASIGVIQTETRVNRTQRAAPLINEVKTTVQPLDPTWGTLEGGLLFEGLTWDDIETGKYLREERKPTDPIRLGFSWNELEDGTFITKKE